MAAMSSAGGGIARFACLLGRIAAELESLVHRINGEAFYAELRLLERRDRRRRKPFPLPSPARAPASPSFKDGRQVARARRARRIGRRAPLSAGATGHG